VTPEDVEEIVDRTILHGEVIQRLLIPERRYAPDRLQFPHLERPLPE
jgi:(2Fe-2S) ferredoxin